MIEEENYGWVPLNKRVKLSIGQILAIASCNLIAGNIYNIVFVFLEDIQSELSISFTIKTIILLMGSLAGFIVTPIVGYYSDRVTIHFGRRRIFIISGLFASIIFLLIMIYCINIGKFLNHGQKSNTISQVLFIIGEVFTLISANIIQLPARVLCSDVCPPHQQNLMAHVCQVYNGAAPFIINILGAFKVFEKLGVSQSTFQLIFSLTLAFTASLISILSTHEEPLRDPPPRIGILKQMHKSFKKMPKSFSRILPVYFCAYLAVYQYTFSFSSFILSLNIKEDKIKFLLICLSMDNFVQLFYGFLNYKICEVIGMKWTMVIGNFLLTVALGLFMVKMNEFAFLAISGLIGLSTVIFMAIPSAIVSIVIPSDELGMNFGILNCVCVLAQQCSNLGIGVGLSRFMDMTAQKKIGYSCVFALCATIASFWVLEPTSADTGNYTQIPEESANDANNGESFIY